uniref:Uncharacterized protein n=1 Tax=Steinernema glaseri TaxID=37863 RepID=A0A1I7ZFH3_9BILA
MKLLIIFAVLLVTVSSFSIDLPFFHLDLGGILGGQKPPQKNNGINRNAGNQRQRNPQPNYGGYQWWG